MKAARDLPLKTITLEQHDRVLTATYTSPPVNMADAMFLRELELVTKAVDRDSSIGAVVLTGGIQERFLTHADPAEIGAFAAMPHPVVPMGLIEPGLRMQNAVLRFLGLARAVERLGAVGSGLVWGYRWKRTILRMNRSGAVYLAAINGPALGGGQELALACDLRYAADAPHVLMGQIEILAGQIPGGGGTQRLPGMIGTGRALEHILEGAPIDAHQALELGLVHRLVAPANLLAESRSTAARLSRRQRTAVAAIKRSVYFGTRRKLGRGLDMELSGFIASALTRPSGDALRALNADIARLGDSPFLAEPKPWIEGTRVNQVP
ncbi:enoyl-CoA hydratase/isomerase family protein [Pseudonocardia sp. GCM10023141]|uniref:enoyl-CoA hydratase/isomerase family protein n=1 Tax=Pseudonocardia sp. GCM10023141 TaxID=3252653 RepID=UPI00361C294E